jgi:hypothetical protein
VPENTISFIQKFAKVMPLNRAPDHSPNHPGFHLGDAHQKQRKPADLHMGANGIRTNLKLSTPIRISHSITQYQRKI